MKEMKRYEEAAKTRTGKINAFIYHLSNVADVSFSVTLDKWKEIEQSAEWAAVKGMITGNPSTQVQNDNGEYDGEIRIKTRIDQSAVKKFSKKISKINKKLKKTNRLMKKVGK